MKSSLFRLVIAIVSLGLLAVGCAMPEAVNIKPIPHAIKPQSSTSAQASQSAGPSTGTDQGAQPKAAGGRDLAKIDLAKTKVAANPASWSAYNDLGVAYYDQGMYDEAIAAFQQALAVHPISSVMDAEKRQRDAAQRQKQAMQRTQEAQAAAQQSAVMGSLLSGLLGVAPIPGMSSVGQQALQAMIPAIEGVSRAASMPNASMADFPELSNPSQLQPRRETALIYSNLGRAYYQKSDYQEAVTSFEKSIALDPSLVSLLEWQAHAQYELSHYERSIAALNRYMTLSRLSSLAGNYILLSKNFTALGMPSESERAFRRAVEDYELRLKAKPGDRAALAGMVQAYLEHKDYAKAQPYAEQLLKQNPNDVNALGMLTICQMAQGRYDLALQTAQRKLKLDGGKVNDYYILGRIYDETRDSEKARAAYQKLVDTYEAAGTDKGMPLGGVAVGYAAIGQQRRAVAMVEEKLFRNPFGSTAVYDYFKLGLVYEKGGRTSEAIEALNTAVEISPRYVFATKTLQRLADKTASHRERLWRQAQQAQGKGSSAQAVNYLSQLYHLMPVGAEKEDLRRKMLSLAARPGGAPRMGQEAQRRFLRGNAALKNAKGPLDLYRALYEYRWATYYAPWAANVYLSTSVVYGLLQKYRPAIANLKLYLTGTTQAANVDQVLGRLYEMEYQREKTLRSLSQAGRL